MSDMASKLFKKYAIGIALLVFVSLFFTDALFLRPQLPVQNSVKTCSSSVVAGEIGNIPKLSEISGPQIDSQAASISCRQSAVQTATSCQTLPQGLWIFLLVSYLALLVFNLSYGFQGAAGVRWGWEVLLTGTFIFGWVYFDRCGYDLWFPLYVVKLGVIVYLGYLYLFEKKLPTSR
jgi:hypothetical protein